MQIISKCLSLSMELLTSAIYYGMIIRRNLGTYVDYSQSA